MFILDRGSSWISITKYFEWILSWNQTLEFSIWLAYSNSDFINIHSQIYIQCVYWIYGLSMQNAQCAPQFDSQGTQVSRLPSQEKSSLTKWIGFPRECLTVWKSNPHYLTRAKSMEIWKGSKYKVCTTRTQQDPKSWISKMWCFHT